MSKKTVKTEIKPEKKKGSIAAASERTKYVVRVAMLCAMAYVLAVIGHSANVSIFAAAPYLTYDPKDIIIAIGGFVWGPLTSFIVSVVVSLIELVTISKTGIIGCVMNIISTCAFACTASFIYKKRRTLAGAVVGLIAGSFAMTGVMILWNYLITPLYTGLPRSDVASLLVPVFLPFNLLKAGLNAGISFLLYKPLIAFFRKSGFIKDESAKKHKFTALIPIAAALVITCVLIILAIKGII